MSLKDRIIETGNFELTIFKHFDITDSERELINDFTNCLFNSYLQEKTVHTETWADIFNDEQLFYHTCKQLHECKVATFTVANNIAFCSLNDEFIRGMFTDDDIMDLRDRFKWNKNRMKLFKPFSDCRVKIGNKYYITGLTRKGFMKQGKSEFKYDLKYLKKYINEIIKEVYKGLSTSTKTITYDEVVEEITKYYSVSNDTYTLGQCNIDSRGRAIYVASSKVLNPVSHKVARALIVLPHEQKLDKKYLPDVYRSIAELFGFRAKTLEERELYGLDMYLRKQLPDVEEDLHSRIWLERIYESLDNVDTQPWRVPLELDVTSSVLTVESLLLNDHDLMDQVNLINIDDIKDAWTFDWCSRSHTKTACTPILYASGKEANELWTRAKLPFTIKQFLKMKNELENGRFKTATEFKKYIIENVSPQEIMEVQILGERFKIKCNRFKWEVQSRKTYSLFDSAQQKVKFITRDVAMVPDTEQFKRYFVTLLVHNIDSQIANDICMSMDYVLPNHDAFMIHPNDIDKLRNVYLQNVRYIYKNRHIILKNYYKSIGVSNIKDNYDVSEGEIAEFSGYNLK